MGSPSACDECGKKFKVFGLKKKCKHCMDVVCKSCLAAHLELKHTHLNGPPRCLRHRKSLEIFDATGNDDDRELQFLSPIGKKESYCAMSPVFQEVCDYENCSVFAVSYAVMATVVVWAVFGLLLALYLRARSLPAGFSYVL
ncbi:hypothetical protein JG688_00018021 [Phytophthora aleatoria]|uniref:FYVE zinc finger domain-containing protein n=1 Tax=Phytophthora aleatoria TaxID=2496075 RepID=A0A8J5IS21_9STRA|nr:hypothetical protein JG688_00018021 [Phytophthora aleatoria]